MSTIEDVMRKLQTLDTTQDDIKTLQSEVAKVLQVEEKTRQNTAEIEKLAEWMSSFEDLQRKCKYLEDLDRSRNLLIYNWSPPQNVPLRQTVLAFFNNRLKISVGPREIEQTRIMGRGPKPAIWVSFSTRSLRIECMRSANLLRGTDIYLREDLPLETRQIQKELNGYRLKAKADGQKAFIRREKLIVNNVPWTLEELRSKFDGTNMELEEEAEGTNKSGSGEEETKSAGSPPMGRPQQPRPRKTLGRRDPASGASPSGRPSEQPFGRNTKRAISESPEDGEKKLWGKPNKHLKTQEVPSQKSATNSVVVGPTA